MLGDARRLLCVKYLFCHWAKFLEGKSHVVPYFHDTGVCSSTSLPVFLHPTLSHKAKHPWRAQISVIAGYWKMHYGCLVHVVSITSTRNWNAGGTNVSAAFWRCHKHRFPSPFMNVEPCGILTPPASHNIALTCKNLDELRDLIFANFCLRTNSFIIWTW